MTVRILTTWDACHLAEIVRAAQGNKPVARLFINNYVANVVYGTARSIGDRHGRSSDGTDDVRDLFLRVICTHGDEHFWRVSELMDEVQRSYFAVVIRP